MNTTTTAPVKSLLSSWRTPANRLDWIVAGCSAASFLYTKYHERRMRNIDTVLKFSSEDPPFYWLMTWLAKMPRQENLFVFKVLPAPQSELKAGEGPKTPLLVPTDGVKFEYLGVECWIEKPDSNEPAQLGSFIRPTLQLRLRTRKRDVCISLLAEIAAVAHEKAIPTVFVHQPRWNWCPVRKLPEGRAAILPNGDYEILSADLASFLQNESWYQSIGLPYRRGYLFHGIPGSGKTSAVIALAQEFKMNVCVLGLNGYSDESLAEAVRNLPANSVLTLEDIDCAWDQERKAKERVTFSGLLNVLDGAATPDGRVTFMTTNRRELLDPALIRPGRVDVEMEFKHATAVQIDQMAKRFSPNAPVSYSDKWPIDKISMAEVQERLIRIYRKPEVAST